MKFLRVFFVILLFVGCVGKSAGIKKGAKNSSVNNSVSHSVPQWVEQWLSVERGSDRITVKITGAIEDLGDQAISQYEAQARAMLYFEKQFNAPGVVRKGGMIKIKSSDYEGLKLFYKGKKGKVYSRVMRVYEIKDLKKVGFKDMDQLYNYLIKMSKGAPSYSF